MSPAPAHPGAWTLTGTQASTAVTLPSFSAVPQVGAASVCTLGTTGAAQEKLPGPGKRNEFMALRMKCPQHGIIQQSSWSQPFCFKPLLRQRSRAEPQGAALATYPSGSAKSLPLGQRHSLALQLLCLWYSCAYSLFSSHDASLMEKGKPMTSCCPGIRQMQGLPALLSAPCFQLLHGAKAQTQGPAENHNSWGRSRHGTVLGRTTPTLRGCGSPWRAFP